MRSRCRADGRFRLSNVLWNTVSVLDDRCQRDGILTIFRL
jgi:hypothetical protein